ncbi:MAG TPA: glucose 1-dehydrogenase [Nitrospirae bacterium]|nr:glucose 1-dehydrogenase [Nitrospirota bacterium]HDZ02439.1 glucose 1-dehydrogenase [Nitrospirota bacterium]
MDLSGKVALVTGASRGIGRETGIQLAKAGAKVIINYNKSKEKAGEVKEAILSAGNEADVFQTDVSNPDEVKALFAFIMDKYNKLDILVNNAGIIKDNLLIAMKLSDWDKVLDTNLRGAFLCTQHAAEMMMANHSGKIINISSIVAIKAVRGQTNYASAKGGLISFTRACAVELAGKGIRINAVLPGMIATDMSSRAIKRAGDRILERIPANRYGNPSDIANVVVFLASDNADYITGQAISVDGGMSIS